MRVSDDAYAGRIRNEMARLAANGRAGRGELSSRTGQSLASILFQSRERLDALRREQLVVALARLSRGSFGICTGCQSDIEPERLEADICTQLCSACGRIRTI